MLLPLLSCLVPLASAGATDAGWMEPGFRASFLGTDASGGAVWDAASWNAWEAAVVAVGAERVTLRYAGASLAASADAEVTYDRTSRRAPDHHAVLWVNPSDVAAGYAFLGHEVAFLVLSTPVAHVFATGTADYQFDAETGLLMSVGNSKASAIRLPTPPGA